MTKPEALPPVNLTDLYSQGYSVYQIDPSALEELYWYFKSIDQKAHMFDCSGVETDASYSPPKYGLSWDHLSDTPAPLKAFWDKLLQSDFLKYFSKRYGEIKTVLPSVAFHTTGDGLPWHNDASADGWHMALALYLTEEKTWDVAWGGSIYFGQWQVDPLTGKGIVESTKDISGPITPKHGQMMAIFGSRVDVAHRVDQMLTQKERITVMLHIKFQGDNVSLL